MNVGELKEFIAAEGIPDEAVIVTADGQRVVGAYPDCGVDLLGLNLAPGIERDAEMFLKAQGAFDRKHPDAMRGDLRHSGWRPDGGYEYGNAGGVLGVFDYHAANNRLELNEDGDPGLVDWGNLADD